MEEALQYLKGLRGPVFEVPLIAFVGDVCRTWHADEHIMATVMEILREARMFRPVRQDPRGFDLLVQRVSGWLGLADFEVPPERFDDLGRSVRDPSMLEGVAMVVAFPVEKGGEVDELGRRVKDKNNRAVWTTSDPTLATIIEQMRLPVLVVYRNGETTWVSGESR